MKIQTVRFREIEVDESRLITFLKGIPGFDEDKQYILLPADETGESPFFFLQSVETAEVSFLLLDAFAFFAKYDVNLDDSVVEKLEIGSPDDVIVLTTVTVQGELKQATTNLKAPLVINYPKQVGMQIVLDNRDYMIKQPLFNNNQKATVGQV
ncbi:flagellar assembly protein FliW [Mesobacillus maritimus]|uniref:flagellar assembly protein FliW n=1 Tax=Mesobacillus maritimus TaxID=1643336 RepID=UPI00384BC462